MLSLRLFLDIYMERGQQGTQVQVMTTVGCVTHFQTRSSVRQWEPGLATQHKDSCQAIMTMIMRATVKGPWFSFCFYDNLYPTKVGAHPQIRQEQLSSTRCQEVEYRWDLETFLERVLKVKVSSEPKMAPSVCCRVRSSGSRGREATHTGSVCLGLAQALHNKTQTFTSSLF